MQNLVQFTELYNLTKKVILPARIITGDSGTAAKNVSIFVFFEFLDLTLSLMSHQNKF